MATKIEISSPQYNEKALTVALRFRSPEGNHYTSQIHINFSDELLVFATQASVEARDFFLLSALVYGIDRFIERRPNSVNGWSRELNVCFPVVSDKWKEVEADIEKLLSFLTGDYWRVSFERADFDLPSTEPSDKYETDFTQVNLFSGGLDSLIGAIDFLRDKPKEKLILVSHYDPALRGTKKDQDDLHERIVNHYPNQFLRIPSVSVSLENSIAPYEKTFRSRSILFIGIACLVADYNDLPIIIPENGSVSLNFPLSRSRRSACSTRTTHPTLLDSINILWGKIGIRSRVTNPYEDKTKGEMVKKCSDPSFLESIIALSNSCGKRGHKRYWLQRNATHCGVCMPCIYRQAALNGIKDATTYGTSINALNFKSDKGQSFGACLDFINNDFNNQKINSELIINGVQNLEKLSTYRDVVMRTREELIMWIKATGSKEVLEKAGLKHD